VVVEVPTLLQPPEEQVALTRKEVRNKDRLKKKNYPIQTYALSGQEASRVTGTSNGKKTLDGPPMLITPTPPGAFGYSDDAWGATFGASMDSFLTLLPGWEMTSAAWNAADLGGAFAGIPTGENLNLYESPGGNQQIQFLVSKNKVKTARGEAKVSNYDEVRSIGVRGPIQMAGWGKSIGIRPTDPDPVDKRKNDDEHKLDASSWKFGPVDMRWDSKRHCWRAFNDLIVDQPLSWKNEGTLVFATNSDTTCGFPFLKGRLEQAWWVRKTCDFAGVIGDNTDRITSAEICTTLLHKWYDDDYKCAGAMADIFLIHRTPTCPVTCGSETTSMSTIELKTEVWFHMDMTRDGPINFTKNPYNPKVDIIGEMKFEGGVWSPVVQHDICSGTEKIYWDRTFTNDISLARKICEVCELILKLHGFAKGGTNDPGKLGGAAAKMGDVAEEVSEAADSIDAIGDSGNEALDSAKDEAWLKQAEYGQDLFKVEEALDTVKTATDYANETSDDLADANAEYSEAYDAVETAHAALNDAEARAADQDLSSADRMNARRDARDAEAALAEAGETSADARAKKDAAQRVDDAAQETAEAARATATDTVEEAREGQQEAEDAKKDWEDEQGKAGPPHPTDEEKAAKDQQEEANANADEALDDAENALGGDKEAQESAEDCCKKNKAALDSLVNELTGGDGGIDDIGLVNGQDGFATPKDVDDAVGEGHKKQQAALNGLAGAFNDATAETVGAINEQLNELGATSVTPTTATAPTVEQDASTGGGTGKGGTDTPDDPPDTGGGSTTGGGKSGPGSVAGGGQTPGTVPREPKVPPPDPPDCGIILLHDPCSGKPKLITCKGGSSGKSTSGGTGSDTGPSDDTNPEGTTQPRPEIGLQGTDGNQGMGLKEGGKAAGGLVTFGD